MDFLRYVGMLVFDEIGQSSVEILAKFDIILRKIRNGNIYMGGVLIIFSMDNTQIHTIGGRPFLTSCDIISCFQTVALYNSVGTYNDDIFKNIRKIVQLNYQRSVDEPYPVYKS